MDLGLGSVFSSIDSDSFVLGIFLASSFCSFCAESEELSVAVASTAGVVFVAEDEAVVVVCGKVVLLLRVFLVPVLLLILGLVVAEVSGGAGLMLLDRGAVVVLLPSFFATALRILLTLEEEV